MDSFEQQTIKAIDILVKKATATVNETIIEACGLVVDKTPVTSGEAISNWVFGVGTAETGKFIAFHNANQNATTGWSNATSYGLGEVYRTSITPIIYDFPITTEFYMENNTKYILALENGEYTGKKYLTDWKPYYVHRRKPFILTYGGVSIKMRRVHAARGMVKSAVRRASRIEFSKMANRYNK